MGFRGRLATTRVRLSGREVVECGGKRSATPLWMRRISSKTVWRRALPPRSKAERPFPRTPRSTIHCGARAGPTPARRGDCGASPGEGLPFSYLLLESVPPPPVKPTGFPPQVSAPSALGSRIPGEPRSRDFSSSLHDAVHLAGP
jgi:hypothetical protein